MIDTVALRDVVEQRTGTINPTTTPDREFLYVDIASIDNVEKRIVAQKSVMGREAPSRARRLIKHQDVLVSTVRPNLNAVAFVPKALDEQVASTGFCVLRPTERISPDYLFYYVRSQRFVDGLSKHVSGAMYPAVSDDQVLTQRLPLPPIPTQRRIVDVLARAEGLVRLHRAAVAKAREIIPALFFDMFGDPASLATRWPAHALSDVATIYSGIAKGRKLGGKAVVQAPYLRVANVKDGFLDLSEVKTIELLESELPRYLVEPGDLLMTEGGDADKLGRAALWSGEVNGCVHQNHIFRVRCDSQFLLPVYACELIGSSYGKRYFLQVAKRTTGIASINKTQLSAFPMPLPPFALQTRFADHVARLRAIQAQAQTALTQAEATFQALLYRAFAGA